MPLSIKNIHLRPLLRAFKRILDPYLSKYIDEYFWRFIHFFPRYEEGCLDKGSLNHPHRKLIIREVESVPQIKRLLELGTGSGANLFELNKYFPKIKCTGIDINSRAIKMGKEIIRKKKSQTLN